MDERDDLVARLQAHLTRELEAPVVVSDLTRLPGGASRETWVFTAATAREEKRFVIRRDPHGAILSSDRATEFELLKRAADAGVPVPRVVSLSDNDFGGPGFIMEFVEGETIARKILRDDEFFEARSVMAAQCGEILGRLHQVDVAGIGGLVSPETNPGLLAVDRFESLLDSMGEPHPTFDLGFRWLRRNPPDPSRITLVHGDFRLGNLIVGDGGIRTVLDWELAHIGDPWEDLGWLLVRAWRFGAPGDVGGFGARGDMYKGYEMSSGVPVDEGAVGWWEIFGTVKWGVICILQSFTHLSGGVRSVELAAIGRRAAEAEHDLMLLLEKK